MEDGHYILPGELAILSAFLLIPSCAVGTGIQFLVLRRLGVTSARFWLSLVVTTMVSVVLTIALVVFASSLLPAVLGVQDIFLGRYWVPVLPLGFVVEAPVAVLSSVWALGPGRKDPSPRLAS